MRRTHSRALHALHSPLALGGIFAVVLCAGIVSAYVFLTSIPSIENFENRKLSESTKIYDRTGKVLLFDVHGTARRTEVALNEISPFIRNATVAIEDAEFYQHKGFRPLSFIRAILANVSSGSYSQGGSTITQQVVKNTLLTRDKTIARKAREIIIALKLERTLTKDQILQIYLNETSYGGTVYGVEEASNYFFGKNADDVTLAEAAYLAALPQAPTRYSPYGNNRELLDKRKDLVLSRMKELSFITEDEYETAKAEVVVFRDTRESGIKAPHFVFYIREYLEEKYGADTVSNGGLRVVTTLDYTLQKKAEEIVSKTALENKKKFNAENAGLVAIDPKTGQILSMVGSRGYFDEDIDGKVNVTLAHRQPGSSFKPFVYATAFEKGYTPETTLFDLRTQFTASCSANDLTTHDNCYAPVNYDDTFRGPMSLRDALAQSINVVAVKILYLVGVDDALAMAERLGISTLEGRDRYGLTLVLGGGEVSLLELTNAYGAFANDGVLHKETGILEVKDASGNILESYTAEESRVLTPEVARAMNDVLSDNIARAPGFGFNSALYFPAYDVAAKTGTTNDYRDAWIVGYTPSIVAGAWAGNNNNTPMEKRVAGFIIAPLWHEFLEYAFTLYPPEAFAPMAPDETTGTLPPVLEGNWNTDPSQGVHEILHWVDKDNPRLPAKNPWVDPQYTNWEYAVALWSGRSVPPPITGPQDFAIASPINGDIIPQGKTFPAFVEYLESFPVTKIAYYVDESLVKELADGTFVAELGPLSKGTHTVKAIAYSAFGVREHSVTITAE